jgi:hypothetical protein
MRGIISGLTKLLKKFVDFAEWILDVIFAIFKSVWVFFQDSVCWVFEQFLLLIQIILNSLPDDFSAFNPATYINGLPADLVGVFGMMRIGEALAMILAAIVIKITLQLIPFTRLGS